MSESNLGHCKLCDLPDFADPEISALIRDVYAADRDHFGDPDFPAGREHRKYWEVAMTLRAFRDFGALHEGAEVLGVGADHEATIYWLTRHVGTVVATDLYETEDVWSERYSDIESGRGGWSQYPHIVLRDGDYLWTSVLVALIKSRLPALEWRRRAPKLPPRARCGSGWVSGAYPVVSRLRKLRKSR